MRLKKTDRQQRGFTLIEVIVTILVVAIFASMMIVFFGSSLTESRVPISRLQKASALHQVMANITADYNKYPKWRGSTNYTAGTIVTPTVRNGHYYTCTTAGVSSSTEPSWPLASGSTVNDGAAVWTENGSVPALSVLQASIGADGSDMKDNAYGKYYVVENKFIKFVSDTETDDTSGENKLLKVTIKNDSGERLTALFISN
jgi:prepilin-type N-terminal cleavage/methylation domain-containing protein